MAAEVIASLVGAAASLVIALVSFTQSRSAQRDAAAQEHAQRKHEERLKGLEAEQQRSLMQHEERLKELEAKQQRQHILLEDELSRRRWQDEQRHKREEVVNRFREPLARAAYDLQSRLWNSLHGRFLETYLVGGTPREKAYAVENTAFVIAQYFAWTEIVRREIQFIDLQEESETAALAHQQDRISHLWGSDHQAYGTVLRIWAGEQRAIGELLVEDTSAGPRCMGYARFVELLHGDHSPFLDVLTAEIQALPRKQGPYPRRLVELQHALINQLEFLDPRFIRFPAEARSKVPTAPDAATTVSTPPRYGHPSND